MEKKKTSLWKEAAMQIAAGGSAGFVEVCLMHPLDLIKTRFQIQGGPNDPNRYNSIADCFRKMYRAEGPFSFYKGILPPILADTPKRAVKFFTFEQYKKAFCYNNILSLPLAFSLSGLCSGLTEAIVINPFEVVKVKLQAERKVTLQEQKSAWETARIIARTKGFGLNGLNLGLTSTLGRHGVFNMVYFGFYHSVKGLVPKPKEKKWELITHFGIGLAAGTLSSCANIPFDVAKSRIQGPQPVPGEIKYKTCFQTLRLVYVEEGFFALYKGLVPKILRLGPGGAIMFLIFENAYAFLQEKFI